MMQSCPTSTPTAFRQGTSTAKAFMVVACIADISSAENRCCLVGSKLHSDVEALTLRGYDSKDYVRPLSTAFHFSHRLIMECALLDTLWLWRAGGISP